MCEVEEDVGVVPFILGRAMPVGEGRSDGMLGSKRSLRSVMYLSNFSALACNRLTHCRSG